VSLQREDTLIFGAGKKKKICSGSRWKRETTSCTGLKKRKPPKGGNTNGAAAKYDFQGGEKRRPLRARAKK